MPPAAKAAYPCPTKCAMKRGSEMIRPLLAYVTLFAIALCAPALAQPRIIAIDVPIIGSKGERIGTARVRGNSNKTVARLAINAGGLTPGWHGIHFHSVGDCSDPGTFELSMGHITSA